MDLIEFVYAAVAALFFSLYLVIRLAIGRLGPWHFRYEMDNPKLKVHLSIRRGKKLRD